MIFFRLSKTDYCADLSGKGAEINGGRWNSKGRALLYTCGSRALCTTEIAVHTPLGIVPLDYCLCSINIPDNSSVRQINAEELPNDWKSFPHPASTQVLGDEFIKAMEYLILKVPSAVVSGDFNFLINPIHPEFKGLRILQTEPFAFDERLFR